MDSIKQETRRYVLHIAALLILLGIAMTAALCIGRYGIAVQDCLKILASKFVQVEQTWTKMMENVVMVLRLPRVLAASLVGAGLAISGAAYQSMFKNPMVSPDILGVSSGASIGACTAILMGMSAAAIQSWAFIGGIAAVTMTAMIPRVIKNDSPIMLVLAGIITGGLMNSILGVVRYLAINSEDETALESMTYWTMGSFAKVNMESFFQVAPVIAAGCLILFLIRYRLNVLSLGEREAKTLGVHVGRTQTVVIVAATFVTASCVCVCGTIGWVGLVVPHLARMIIGPDNKKMLPIAMLLGAVFMLVVDTLCRSISSAELPVSIITGIVGAPFYFYLLYRQRMGMR